jgi:hypothetical protein
MTQKFQSLDEIMREEEARLIAEARAREPAERAQWEARRIAEKARRATIPVWIGHDDKIHGPFANDDAAEKHVEEQKWDFSECVFGDSEQEVKDAMAAAKGADDDGDDDEEEE